MNAIKGLLILLAIVFLYGCQQSPTSEKSMVEQAVTNSVQ